MTIEPMPEPFYKITPAEHLQMTLDDAGMTAAEFARKSGIPRERVDGILSGAVAPTDDDAVATAAVWGMSANCWRGLFGLPKVAQRKADKNVMFWTTAEKKEQIRACASAHNLSISAFILQCVDAAIEADSPPRPRFVAMATEKDIAATTP